MTPSSTGAAASDFPTLELPTATAWFDWLREHHRTAPEIWLKIAKPGAPRPTPTYAQALEVALCFGWIDGQKGRVDEVYWRQRFTPRGPRSRWSQRNRDLAEALMAAGRMQPAGREQVVAAQRDGRWEAAYAPQSTAGVPDDFAAALERHPEAKAVFATLTGANRYAFIYRINEAKRPQTRVARIERFVEMLGRGETFHP